MLWCRARNVDLLRNLTRETGYNSQRVIHDHTTFDEPIPKRPFTTFSVRHCSCYQLHWTRINSSGTTSNLILRDANMAPDLNSISSSPSQHRQLLSQQSSTTSSRRPSHNIQPPVAPMASHSPILSSRDQSDIPIRHPRPLTAAELHLELEKESEAVVRLHCIQCIAHHTDHIR